MNTTKISLPIQYWDNQDIIELFPKDGNNRTIRYREFQGVQFTGLSYNYPLNLLYSQNKLYLPLIEQFMSLGRGTIYEDDMFYSGELFEIKRKVSNPVFYFVYNTVNYYHFIYDTLPYLVTFFEKKKQYPNLKLLMDVDNTFPFVWDCLKLLGIDKTDIEPLDFYSLYSTVIVGSSLTHDNLSNFPPHNKALDLIQSMEGTSSCLKRVYISRRTWTQNKNQNIGTDYTERRKCVNEDEVFNLFQKYGFVEVFCENLSMKDKIGVFQNAEVIAGAIGGGMCNCLFSPPKTRVISINSPGFFDVNKRFEFSMNHTQLHHFNDCEFIGEVKKSIDGDSALSISGGINSPWKVNLNTLETFLDDVLYG